MKWQISLSVPQHYSPSLFSFSLSSAFSLAHTSFTYSSSALFLTQSQSPSSMPSLSGLSYAVWAAAWRLPLLKLEIWAHYVNRGYGQRGECTAVRMKGEGERGEWKARNSQKERRDKYGGEKQVKGYSDRLEVHNYGQNGCVPVFFMSVFFPPSLNQWALQQTHTTSGTSAISSLHTNLWQTFSRYIYSGVDWWVIITEWRNGT